MHVPATPLVTLYALAPRKSLNLVDQSKVEAGHFSSGSGWLARSLGSPAGCGVPAGALALFLFGAVRGGRDVPGISPHF